MFNKEGNMGQTTDPIEKASGAETPDAMQEPTLTNPEESKIIEDGSETISEERKEEVSPEEEPEGTSPEEEPEEASPREEPEEAPPKKKPAIDGQKLCQWIRNALPVLAFLISVICVGYYVIFPSRGEFHADCTDTIYWANASYESGHILSEDFCYACLLPFGGNLLMQIFMPFFGLSMTTHILGMFLFFVLFILFFCLMLREAGLNYRYICVAGAVLLATLCASQKVREIFWGHVIYYSLGVLFLFIGMFLLFRLRNLAEQKSLSAANEKQTRLRRITTLVIFLIFFLLTCTDGISSLTIFALPMTGAIFAEALVDNQAKLISRRNGKTALLLCLMAVMLVLGMKLGSAWAGDITAGYETAYSNYGDKGEWLTNAQKLPLAWLDLLGLQNMPGERMMSGDSIKNLIHIMAAALIAVVPIAATICYPRYTGKKGRHLRVAVWVHWAVTALILVGWICGMLSAAAWRLTPIIATSTMLTLLFACWAISKKTNLTRLAVLLMIPITASSALNVWDVAHMPYDNYKDSDLYQLADYLEENKLTYGYATFWNANAITIIADNHIKARNVNVDENGVNPNFYQTQTSWYEDQEDQDKYFLLLSQGEYDTLVNNASDILNTSTQFLQLQTTNGSTFYVLVYPENLF